MDPEDFLAGVIPALGDHLLPAARRIGFHESVILIRVREERFHRPVLPANERGGSAAVEAVPPEHVREVFLAATFSMAAGGPKVGAGHDV